MSIHKRVVFVTNAAQQNTHINNAHNNSTSLLYAFIAGTKAILRGSVTKTKKGFIEREALALDVEVFGIS